jgi:hypothetical protein
VDICVCRFVSPYGNERMTRKLHRVVLSVQWRTAQECANKRARGPLCEQDKLWKMVSGETERISSLKICLALRR